MLCVLAQQISRGLRGCNPSLFISSIKTPTQRKLSIRRFQRSNHSLSNLFPSSLHLNHTDHKKLFTHTLIYTYPTSSSTYIILYTLYILHYLPSLYSTLIPTYPHIFISYPNPYHTISPVPISPLILLSTITLIHSLTLL